MLYIIQTILGDLGLGKLEDLLNPGPSSKLLLFGLPIVTARLALINEWDADGEAFSVGKPHTVDQALGIFNVIADAGSRNKVLVKEGFDLGKSRLDEYESGSGLAASVKGLASLAKVSDHNRPVCPLTEYRAGVVGRQDLRPPDRVMDKSSSLGDLGAGLGRGPEGGVAQG